MSSVPNNLRPQATPFVGRKNEIAAISQLLDDSTHRLITVLGPGGMGKTRLSLAVAEHQLANERFSDGVYFVPLAGVEDSDRIVSVIAEAMGLSLEQGERQLHGYLRNRQVLFVLDNFEQLLEGGDLIPRLLDVAPHVRILVTSRERLRLQAEQVFPIQGLLVDNEAAMDDARRLFIQTAARIRPEFRQTDGNLPLLNQICHLVEGMPLALELAAVWVDTLSLSDIVGEIKQNLGFLETDMRDVPRRHRSMAAVFNASWRNLSAELQQLMAQVSVFRGGFTREAAETIANASLRNLATLVNKSFLRFDPAANRYHIHELMRQFSAGQLESMEARDAHSAYYRELVRRQYEMLIGHGQDEAIDLIEIEMDNIRAAINHALRRGQIERFKLVLHSLTTFYAYRNRNMEAILLNEHVRRELSRKSEPSPRLLFWAIMFQATFLGGFGRAAEARELLEEAKSILTDLTSQGVDTREEQAYALYEEGYDVYADRPAEARVMLQKSYDLSMERGDLRSAGLAMTVIARAARNEGDLASAEAAVDEAMRLFQTLGNRRMIVGLQLLSGNLAAIAGRYEEAERRLLAGIEAIRPLNQPFVLANGGFNKLQMVYFFSGRFDKASEPLEESRRLVEEYGISWGIVQSSLARGTLHLHQGEYREVRIEIEKAIELIGAQGFTEFFTCEALVILAQADIVLEAYETAERHLRECDELCDSRPVGMPTFVAGNPLYRGILAAARGETVVAREHLMDELETAASRNDRLNLANALAGFAYLHAVEQDAAAALEQYTLAKQHPFVANSRWFDDVIGRRVREAAQALSPAQAEAINDRCEGSDMETTVAELLAQPGAPLEAAVPGQPLLDPLSERELELLCLVAAGKSNREIAAELYLALGTVKSHLHNIYQKLDAASRTQAIIRAQELNLL